MAKKKATEKNTTAKKAADTDANLGFESKLWAAADALRNNMDAAEYKHVVLGLIFLKYISDAFEAKHAELEADRKSGADPEDPDEYRAVNIFWVPKEARWSHLKASAPQPTIGSIVDEAMTAIERDNPSLKSVLPKDYARPGLDKQRLGQLVNLISDIALGAPADRAKDTLGRVYEYFLSQFASAEGKKGGQFYTPSRVVRVLVEMLAPYKGRVYDPCCGSGGMFVQSEKFIEAHSGKIGDISIYGQESNYTTWRLAKMNLAIRGIDAQIGHGDTFHEDRHPDLKADFILANPPFNSSDWRGDLLKDDKRWAFGVPPAGNANYAWVQHFIHHLAPTGLAGFVLANGSMSSNTSGEGEIRKAIIEADLVDCMVALPGQLFYSTQIPVCLWFIARDKSGRPSPGASHHPLPSGEDHYRGGFDFSGLVERARELRKKQTPAEQVMWEMVRDRRFMGLKFRRQHQIGDYIADFYCDEKKLIIELDGPIHNSEKRRSVDQKRDRYLASLGLTVIRITNEQLLTATASALAVIEEHLVPSPSGRGAGVRGRGFRNRKGETLFIDARRMGTLIDRVHRELTDDDLARIAGTYHAWRGDKGAAKYEDVPGFCKSATVDEIRKHGHVLTPGRYVGAEAVEDDGEPFEEKMKRLTTQWHEQQKEAAKLDAVIAANLKELGYGG
ncbi:MAG: N-6 DNA methylase [Leptonema illini]|uniref:site-specific DNA-methyltransferase (adenine-specific) n=1 Tax=Leptonema illini TaxID=183 RepID=A0A833GYH0_9LEPT|nr:MAG: N-6 DNA methylase [Leptonema illini]